MIAEEGNLPNVILAVSARLPIVLLLFFLIERLLLPVLILADCMCWKNEVQCV